jgi:hypothetical protein
MRQQIIEAIRKHAEGHIAKHVANVEVYLENAVGVGEHTDILESIEQELSVIETYHAQLELLDTYFEREDTQTYTTSTT